MGRLALLNGERIDEPVIRAVSSAALYGKGVFTTAAIREGKPFLWEKHLMRLASNAARLSIELSDRYEQEIPEHLETAILQSGLRSGRARITVFDDSPTSPWGGDGQSSLRNVLITVAEHRPRPDRLRLTLSPYPVNTASPLAGVKSCNYLEPLMAYDEARGRGHDEAIRINEKGYVTSACMANVFWETDGKLYTPSLSTGCLPGTTREFVMENFDCEEVEAGVETIESADRIFLTSAGLGVAQVAEFNGRRLNDSEHRILELLPR